jgi:FkbM family methyltransferase
MLAAAHQAEQRPARREILRNLSVRDLAALSREEAEIAIRARVRTTSLGEKRVLSCTLGHQKVFLSTDDLGFAGHVMLDGFWEIWLTLFMSRFVEPGMTVVDVGPNFGHYTVLFGEAVGSGGRVVVVEPVPSTARPLALSIGLNGYTRHTTLHEVALGRNANGEAHMFVPPHEPKNALVVPRARSDTIKVKSTNLDTLLKSFDRVDLIKIDAEGAELDFLSGKEAVIAEHQPALVLVFNAHRYADAKAFPAKLRKLFPRIRTLRFDGSLVLAADEDLLDARSREDAILFLEARI